MEMTTGLATVYATQHDLDALRARVAAIEAHTHEWQTTVMDKLTKIHHVVDTPKRVRDEADAPATAPPEPPRKKQKVMPAHDVLLEAHKTVRRACRIAAADVMEGIELGRIKPRFHQNSGTIYYTLPWDEEGPLNALWQVGKTMPEFGDVLGQAMIDRQIRDHSEFKATDGRIESIKFHYGTTWDHLTWEQYLQVQARE